MLVLDSEIFGDYFLLSFLEIETGKIRHFEMFDGHAFDSRSVGKIMAKYTTISFNGLHFDLPIICAALQGFDNRGLKQLCDKIIKSGDPSWKVCRELNIDVPTTWDHVDLIEVAPGMSSLKIYGGRMNAPTIQSLPFPIEASILPEQRQLVRDYCENDLATTKMLFLKLKPAIDLRADMSKTYGMDLRSKSDAQIAETIIVSEMHRITGKAYRAPKLPNDFGFRYKDPRIINFETPSLVEMFKRIKQERFTLGGNGQVVMPAWLRESHVVIAGRGYQMGIGGLHSCEKSQFRKADADHVIADWDVASYYPSIILQQRLSPAALGKPFLDVYRSLVTRRIAAKKAGDKVTADTLKIAVNGSFGKLGSKYSTLFAPELLIQTTLTGQLALLMLIERLSAAGVEVVSANTDGIVLHHRRDLECVVDQITFEWMLDTSYTLERTEYAAIASRDVNNYVAVTTLGKVKGKGCFAPSGLSKNPDMPIIYAAVAKQIATGKHYRETVAECADITQFCMVRRVNGGACWRGDMLGSAVRYYASTAIPHDECIMYATNSNRVPKSSGCKPLMTLPDKFPSDVDYSVYLTAAEKLLCEVGHRDA